MSMGGDGGQAVPRAPLLDLIVQGCHVLSSSRMGPPWLLGSNKLDYGLEFSII